MGKHLRRFWLETIIGIVVIGAVVYALITHSYSVSGGGFLYASLVSYLLCFALTSFYLNRQGAKFLDRVFLSILSMLSGIILFEIVYHYGFGISGAQLYADFSYFGNAFENGSFPLDWYLLIFASLFIGRKYMAFNWFLVAMSALGAIIMLAWIGSNYPQSFGGQAWTARYLPVYNTFHVKYLGPSAILQSADFYNSNAKMIAVIPAFLFYKKKPSITPS